MSYISSYLCIYSFIIIIIIVFYLYILYHYACLICILHILGSTVVSPYVGMARKQNGGYNARISVQTPIFHLVVNSTRLKTVRSPRWCCPNSTMAPRLLENVVKVTNLEVVKIVFSSQPSALTLYALMTCFDVIHTSDTITLSKSAKIFRN